MGVFEFVGPYVTVEMRRKAYVVPALVRRCHLESGDGDSESPVSTWKVPKVPLSWSHIGSHTAPGVIGSTGIESQQLRLPDAAAYQLGGYGIPRNLIYRLMAQYGLIKSW